jgi:hypothetical protein
MCVASQLIDRSIVACNNYVARLTKYLLCGGNSPSVVGVVDIPAEAQPQVEDPDEYEYSEGCSPGDGWPVTAHESMLRQRIAILRQPR